MAAALAGVGLVIAQAGGIGLYDVPAFQKQESHLVRRHPRDEGFGFVEGGAEA